MSDARRRYLRIQAELGGSEVILGGAPPIEPSAPTAASAPEPEPAAPASADAPTATEAVAPAPVAAAAEGDVPKWRRGAPPIPGPGLTVVSEPGSLLGDAISRLESLDAVAGMIAGCRACRLCEGRTHTVPGEGNPAARLLCVGEGPGEQEDRSGRPFVGRAGQLLDDILAAIDLPRPSVFIANIVKCRPPQNRKPLPDEMAACLPYLRRQVALLRPKVILALGATAAEGLLGAKASLGELRKKVHRYDGVPVIVTYHPAALLRNPNWKKPAWDDVRIARQLLDA